MSARPEPSHRRSGPPATTPWAKPVASARKVIPLSARLERAPPQLPVNVAPPAANAGVARSNATTRPVFFTGACSELRSSRSVRNRRTLHRLKLPEPAGRPVPAAASRIDRYRVDAAQLRGSAVVPNAAIEAEARTAERQFVAENAPPGHFEIDCLVTNDPHRSDVVGGDAIDRWPIGYPDGLIGGAFRSPGTACKGECEGRSGGQS